MESQQVEYKKSFGKEVIISLVAFANMDGGKVIVGVDDKGRVCGVDVGPETLQRYLNEIKVATYPQLFPKIWGDEKDEKNILVFEAFYLAGDIERYGTGFVRIRESLKDYPELALSVEEVGDFFKVELRLNDQVTPQVTPQVTTQVTTHVTTQVTTQVTILLKALEKPRSRRELQEKLGLRNREHFRRAYLRPALQEGLIAMSNPEKPRAADQRYSITERGRDCLARLSTEGCK